MAERTRMTNPQRADDAAEINYGSPPAPDFGPLARDRIPVRTMIEGDLERPERNRPQDHRARPLCLFRAQARRKRCIKSDIRVSLVAERDGGPVGFIMARVDFGEFGHVEPTAVMDTIGVDPDYRDQGIGRALISQLLINLMTLQIEHIRTEIDWRDRDLLGFLDHCGFRPSQQLCFERSFDDPT